MCQMGFVVFAVFKLDFGVRLGSVLSPILFAVYIDDLARSCDIVRGVYIVGLLYADDILLLSPIVCELQKLLHTRERELNAQDLVINVKKSCCLRVGPRIVMSFVNVCVLCLAHICRG